MSELPISEIAGPRQLEDLTQLSDDELSELASRVISEGTLTEAWWLVNSVMWGNPVMSRRVIVGRALEHHLASQAHGNLAGPTAVYRLFTDEGELLYVGITVDPDQRFDQHASSKHWWGSVGSRSIEWFGSRINALGAERQAITTEHPIYNIAHNGVAR